MTSLLSGIAGKISSYLPQNEHSSNVTQIQSQIQELSIASTSKTGEVFQSKIQEIKDRLHSEKHQCLTVLKMFNGAFFEDPTSQLKKAWDYVVEKVDDALHVKLESRDKLEEISNTLASRETNEPVETAKLAIGYYTYDEERRDRYQTRLMEILSKEKTDPNETLFSQESLENQLTTLRERQQALCGAYYQDPSSLLDQKWKAHGQALFENDERAQILLQEYNALEQERKTNESKIFSLQEQIRVQPASPDQSIESLTLDSIQKQVDSLGQEKIKESALSGVDWKETGVLAGSLTLLPAGFIAATLI